MNAYTLDSFRPERRLQAEQTRPGFVTGAAFSDRMKLHRTIFISDPHLGTRGCEAAMLADFLANNDCRTLYLVGDILDGERRKPRVPQHVAYTSQDGFPALPLQPGRTVPAHSLLLDAAA